MKPKSFLPAFLVIVLFWPLVGLFVSAFNLEFAPPFTWIKNTAPLLSCINIPFGLLHLVSLRLNGKVRMAFEMLVFTLPILVFVLMSLSPFFSETPACQSVPAETSKVRFVCKTPSIDNYGYSYVFTLEGYKYFPLLNVVEEKQLIPDP